MLARTCNPGHEMKRLMRNQNVVLPTSYVRERWKHPDCTEGPVGGIF